VTCLSALLTASVVIAASLLGGCSDIAIGTPGGAAQQTAPAQARMAPTQAQTAPPAQTAPAQTAPAQAAAQTPPPPQTSPSVDRAAPQPNGQPLDERLASAALDDQRLSEVRGGFETSSGVVLNFAFQQATYINHQLVQSVVVPTLTVSPSSLGGLSVASQAIPAMSGTTVMSNGTVQTQVSTSSPVIQALVNSGMTSVVSTVGNGGLTSVISNSANNRVVQQMTTLNIGVTGLSGLLQQSIPSMVLNRLVGANSFR
jgi:hypothetical protein